MVLVEFLLKGNPHLNKIYKVGGSIFTQGRLHDRSNSEAVVD